MWGVVGGALGALQTVAVLRVLGPDTLRLEQLGQFSMDEGLLSALTKAPV